MDRCGTADIGRQARKSVQRDAIASGKRFDAVLSSEIRRP